MDEESGLYYYGARYYDPRISIWASVDPLVEETMDAYGYCYQNPINLVDSDGMKPKPFPKMNLGSTYYYKWRYNNFIYRNPNYIKQHPEFLKNNYYLNYGHKYVNRFANVVDKTLTNTGKTWSREVRKSLQEAIEDKLKKDPTIELKNGGRDFNEFAFNSHVDAYWNKDGKVPLYTLGAVDLTKILLAPDAKDLINSDGLRQVAGVLNKFISEKPEEFQRILFDAAKNYDIILKLIENKAKKEGVPVDVIKNVISPFLNPIIILIPSKEKKKK